MQPTVGFIPPPVVPLVPTAANGIVATGGLLAGAAAGAKAGAVLGPKGVLVGAAIGAVAGLLLLPLPTTDGPVPGLDPGLNRPARQTEPAPVPPETFPLPQPPGAQPGQRFDYVIKYRELESFGGIKSCSNPGAGFITEPRPLIIRELETRTVNAEELRVETNPGYKIYQCGSDQLVENRTDYALKFQHRVGQTWYDGPLLFYTNYIKTIGSTFNPGPIEMWAEIESIEVDGEPLPLPFPEPEVPTRPRPTPIPIEPLPEIAPSGDPDRALIPEPGPQPQPLEVPNPGNPDAPPVTIPKAPPAPPVEVPNEEPKVLPGQVPTIPATPSPTLPVPGVPTVPETTPDPSISPAPGPAPAPLPGVVPIPGPSPTPVPGGDPAPGVSPGPSPIPLPGTPATPNPVTPPATPTPVTGTDPGGGIVKAPTKKPVVTPPGNHYPVPGGPPVTGGGVRKDLQAIATEVGRIEQKVARMMHNPGGPDLGDLLQLLNLLSNLFEEEYDSTQWELTGVCEELNDEGEQPVTTFPVTGGKAIQAILNRIDALPDVLQQHLRYRTPVCHGKPSEGEFRTISFISDEVSPNGRGRVAKRLCYRSKSGTDLGGLIDYWKDFAWQAGPVIVEHRGAWWGSVQVWAASINEGKRVIRHAAGEAGLDPDQVGRWSIGGSDNPRYGVPGTMRVNTNGGYYWVTARDGPSPRPQVGST